MMRLKHCFEVKQKRWFPAFAGLGLLLMLVFWGYRLKQAEPAPSFHPLVDLAYERSGKNYSGESYQVRTEYIVIANPPKERQVLQALVDAYNEKTLSQNELEKWTTYKRWFYRESSNLPRDYKESGGYFDKDRIEHHGDDMLVIVTWGAFGKERTYEFSEDMP